MIKELYNLYESYKNTYERMLTDENVDIRHLEKAKGKMYGSRDAWKLSVKQEEKIKNYENAIISIYDYLKLTDNDIIENDIDINHLGINKETLSEMLFRKLEAYDIDIRKDTGFDHLSPVKTVYECTCIKSCDIGSYISGDRYKFTKEGDEYSVFKDSNHNKMSKKVFDTYFIRVKKI